MSSPIRFTMEKKLANGLGRAGVIETPHGNIETPAFIVVGTKGTVKTLSPEQVLATGAQAVLANTYHLYLQPGDKEVARQGGLHKMMQWQGPTFTDSGGFQAFSLGAAFGKGGVSKVANGPSADEAKEENDSHQGETLMNEETPLAKISEEGVMFRSHIDGSEHLFTPERAMEIQHNIGADIMFAFDECTSPRAPEAYQREAMDRTHRWAKRCVDFHKASGNDTKQGLFGVVQGGRHKELREESARVLGAMDFAGFGIGGSFTKDDMYTAVGWVSAILPEDKPRHLLGIGEPMDLFGGAEHGADTFDCVASTRMARHGSLYTEDGRINIRNAQFVRDLGKIDEACSCYTCAHFTRAYVSHLFRAQETFGQTLASIHNTYFIVNLVKKIRQSMLDDTFSAYKKSFIERYYKIAL